VSNRIIRPAVATVAAVLALFTATACTFFGKDSHADAPKAPPGTGSRTVSKTAHNNVWSWAISKVGYAPSITDNQGVKKLAGGKVFYMVTTKIKNLTATSHEYNVSLDRAFDASGKEYPAYTGLVDDGKLLAGFFVDANEERPAVLLFGIPPGLDITGISVGSKSPDGVKIDLR
jgi:hypothetical protein